MALKYFLEFNYDESTRSDSAVYIHLRQNPPVYKPQIDKEDYDVLPVDQKHIFLTSIFNIAGVTEVSSRAYRIWLVKSPIYTWEEVVLPVLYYISTFFGESGIEEIPGSGKPNGSGNTLPSPTQRRKL
jgi:hypothetical protein